jgi:hypothetical protein
LNKKDFQDGDVVSFLDTPYNRERNLVASNWNAGGEVVYASETLGVLIKVNEIRKMVNMAIPSHAYYFANQIECEKA